MGKLTTMLLGNLYQSETMQYVRLTMQREVVQTIVEEVGSLEGGAMEFVDLAHHLNAFQRQFAHEVKRCEEVERKLRFLQTQLKKADIQPIKSPVYIRDEKVSLDFLETELEAHEKEIMEHNEKLEQLNTMKNKNEELKEVLTHAGSLINFGEAGSSSDGNDDDKRTSSGLGFLVGVLASDKIPVFKMLIYRATRGNVIPRDIPLKDKLYDPRVGKAVEKSVFVVYFGANAARDKIKKICDSIGASLHDIPEGDHSDSLGQVKNSINQYEDTMSGTTNRKNELLESIAEKIENWKQWVTLQKSCYHTMNFFEYKRNLCIAEGWVPEFLYSKLEGKINDADLSMNVQTKSLVEHIPTGAEPPTYFETNQFTACFQDIVNAYGIPKYKEINPAPISIITFPFLFAVMFGDFGHGFILLAFALALILGSKKIAPLAEASELIGMIFSGRWVMLLMSIFSIYTGLLYNDCFGLAFNIFGTKYEFDEHTELGTKSGNTYVFGVDPAWFNTVNKLMFYNSLKMKMSIIFGIIHMMIGIFYSFLNHIQFRHFEDIFFEFIPEVIILGGTFGYMSVLIIYKWCIDYTTYKYAPASILNTMTDFFLHPWELQQPPIFDHQLIIQLVCLITVAIMCPILLLPKPFYECIHHRLTHKKHGNKLYANMEEDHSADDHQPINAAQNNEISHENPHDEDHKEISLEAKNAEPAVAEHAEGEHEGEFNFTEVFIRQLIHTIEFVLGTVSNTASYLRLWALSLAHAQLSEVFWDMTMKLILTFEIESWPAFRTVFVSTGIGILIAYTVWINLTVGILCGMEALSAFLHSLRLHWVEFQNKFYKGDGHLFHPYSCSNVLRDLRIAEAAAAEASA